MSIMEKNISVEQLLNLNGSDFVKACYLNILFREPDPSGFSHYTSRIAKGEKKLEVAADLASSDEAKALPANRKLLIGSVLGLHASDLISHAFTPTRRRNAIRRTQRYFDVVSPVNEYTLNFERHSVAKVVTLQTTGDPINDYLNSVINATDE